MRYLLIAWLMLFGAANQASAQVSVGVGFPGISIGINIPVYPRLVPVPGLPVYYDPRANFNYFFYDGLYWVYWEDGWYESMWYNGPWQLVAPEFVPVYVLRVPIHYYRRPPPYFRGWRADAPPHWGEHWGPDWEAHRRGWNHWNRRSIPRAAPLPSYQREYSGERYPREAEQQSSIRSRHYRYQPREAVTQQHFQRHEAPAMPRGEVHPRAPVQQPSPVQQPRAQPVPQPPQQTRPPVQGMPSNTAPRDKGGEDKHGRQEKEHGKKSEERTRERSQEHQRERD